MKRDRTQFLAQWLRADMRKPLVIRGARQTGKTWIVRDFARLEKKNLIELNFEKRPDLESLFSSNDPKEILLHLTGLTGKKITPSESLLFLDEIQTVPHLLQKLRWFAEDMPELPLIAAGSLLDFTLANHKFSMPVGRISYMYLEPLSFEEFLDALGLNELREYLKNYQWDNKIPLAIHNQLIQKIKEYLIVGGMPAAVLSWINEKAPEKINQIQFDLIATYRDDFSKYNGRLDVRNLEAVFSSIPSQLSKKFVYKNVNPDVSSVPLKQAVHLLTQARIAHFILSTSANGLPLGAEVNQKFFKMILLDCGLCSASLGLSLHQLLSISDISLVNNGAMAEQLVGQILRTIGPAYASPSLYYWMREKVGSDAEIDYIIQHESEVIPVEVKAGTSGKLKSLHYFMGQKKKDLAIRINADLPRRTLVNSKNLSGTPQSKYKLLSLPFYLLGQLHRLVKQSQN